MIFGCPWNAETLAGSDETPCDYSGTEETYPADSEGRRYCPKCDGTVVFIDNEIAIG